MLPLCCFTAPCVGAFLCSVAPPDCFFLFRLLRSLRLRWTDLAFQASKALVAPKRERDACLYDHNVSTRPTCIARCKYVVRGVTSRLRQLESPQTGGLYMQASAAICWQ